MRVLITRPREDAESLAEGLQDLGIETMVEPLLEVTFHATETLDLDGVRALLVTSANGIRAFAAQTDRRDLPVYAVGEASASAARTLGFGRVESAAGDVEALAALVKAKLDPEDGPLLHVAGTHLAGDLGASLEQAGFGYRRTVLYGARPVERLSDEVVRAFREGAIDVALFFSPRTAQAFVNLAHAGALDEAFGTVAAVCLSPAVGDRARALSWREVVLASRPDQEAMIAAIADMRERKTGTDFGKASNGSDMTEEKKPDAEDPKEPGDSTSTDPASGTDGATVDGDSSTDGPWAARESSTEPAPDDAEAPSAETAEAEPPPEHAVQEEALPERPKRPSVVLPVIFWIVIILAAIGGGLFASQPYWTPYAQSYIRSMQGDPFEDPRLTGLSDRLAAVEGLAQSNRESGDVLQGLEAARAQSGEAVQALLARVGELEQALEETRESVAAAQTPPPPEPEPQPQQTGEADRSVQELSDRIARLEAAELPSIDPAELERLSAENVRLSEALAEVSRQVGSLEEAARTTGAGAEKMQAMLVAIAPLRDVLRTSEPFAEELEALSSVAGEHPELAEVVGMLQPYAGTGIPTLTTVRTRFDATAREVAKAARPVEDDGWVGSVLNRLSSLVTVRRTGEDAVEGSADAALDQAEAALAAGELATAIKAVESLGSAAAEAARPWLDDARARAAAERALATLHIHTVSLLSPAGK